MTEETLNEGATLADRLFDAQVKYMSLEGEVQDAIMAAFGIDPDDTDSWPHQDFTYDYYDSSWEFKGVKPGWNPTEEQVQATFALGFHRCWICYADGTEAAYCAPRQPRTPSTTGTP